MNTALRLTIFALYPLLVANLILWWPISKLGCLVAIALMVLAPTLLPDGYEG